MRRIWQISGRVWALSLFTLALCAANTVPKPGLLVSQRFKQLTRSSKWLLAGTLPINFNTHHPQGLVKIGELFYLSAVEVIQPTKRFSQPQNGLDRDAGVGVGHLFKFDAHGNLLADLKLGEGSIYHPGGIDYDGRFIWVPVAEYRPHSHSIIYRVDPNIMRASEVFRYADHIGGIVHNTSTHTLHGISWGSRSFYQWNLNQRNKVTDLTLNPDRLRKPNRSFYIDYQDCKYLGRQEMMCGGLSHYQNQQEGSFKNANLSLGGLELINLASGLPIYQLPFEFWTKSGLPMTNNPFWIEPTEKGLRAYFLPEDQISSVFIYEVNTPAATR